jgi:hypothetical protein
MLRMLSIAVLFLTAGVALAQNTPTAPTHSPPAKGDSSDRMSRQKDTITPPNVDPGMTVRPPRDQITNTPVIRPPGSQGGNGSVVPK